MCSPSLRLRHKDIVSYSAASFCVYSFYMLLWSMAHRPHNQKWIREHHPAWLSSGVINLINSLVCIHLVDSNHSVQPTQVFRPIYLIRKKQPKFIWYRILRNSEALRFNLFDSLLCAQKQFLQALKLPWPTSQLTQITILRNRLFDYWTFSSKLICLFFLWPTHYGIIA